MCFDSRIGYSLMFGDAQYCTKAGICDSRYDENIWSILSAFGSDHGDRSVVCRWEQTDRVQDANSFLSIRNDVLTLGVATVGAPGNQVNQRQSAYFGNPDRLDCSQGR
jgi:hypothetical protein